MRSFLSGSLKICAATMLSMFLLAFGFQAAGAADFRVGLVLDRGGKDDKSFNSSAYQGATEAKQKLGIFLKFTEAADDNAYESLLRAFAQRDFDLIIGIGFAQKEAVKKVAAQFPDRHFAIVDSEVDLPNVRSLLFEEQEGSYLVGAIAAMTSKTGKIGFVGGMDIPLIRRFEMGYEAGAKKINPQISVTANYVGVTSEAWNNPPKGKELAIHQYDDGADIIFIAAGASGLGVFDAAEEQKKFAIGVDSNQDWIKPGLVLTSMLKRVDRAVYTTIEEAKTGKFTGGVTRFGLADHGEWIIRDGRIQREDPHRARAPARGGIEGGDHRRQDCRPRLLQTTLMATGAPAAVELRELTKRFGNLTANAGVSLRVEPGTIHGVIGENGAGKSTAMKMLYGIYRPDAGEIFVHGRKCAWSSPSAAIASGIGMVHQHFMLAGPYSALDNILLGAEPRRWGIIDRRRRRARATRSARPTIRPASGLGQAGRAIARRHPATHRNPQAALSRREHSHPRRTHRRPHAAGNKRSLR